MKKLKRIFAIAGVAVILGLYVATAVSALFVTPATEKFFLASLVATMAVPLALYVLMFVIRIFGERMQDGREDQEDAGRKGFEEAFGHGKQEP